MKRIEYQEVSDIKEMQCLGFTSAPMLDVDGKIMNFIEANKWITNYKKED